MKKVHRVWREEGLQVTKRRRRKRVGGSSGPIVDADASNVVWAIDFQFDSTADGCKFKITSMVDEHTRESLLDLTERSITGDDLVIAPEQIIAVRGVPVLLRCDNGPELISHALRLFCEDLIGILNIPPGEPWRNGFVESFNNRVRDECLNMNQWIILLHVQVGISDWKTATTRITDTQASATKPQTGTLQPAHTPTKHRHLKRGHPITVNKLLHNQPGRIRPSR